MKLERVLSCRLIRAVCLLAGLVSLSGCSGSSNDRWRQQMPPTYAIGGTVTFRGKPLGGATIVFHPQEGASASQRAASGLTDKSGRFTLTTVKPGDGAVAGSFVVTVHKTSGEIPGAVTTPPDEFGAFPLGADPSSGTSLIPEKYAEPGSSGLTAEVQPGHRNHFTFTLE